MNHRRHLSALALPIGLCLGLVPTSAAAQGVTATAVAQTTLAVSSSPNSQSLPAGTDLSAGANLSVSAGPTFGTGGAGIGITLTTQPALSYQVSNTATSLFNPFSGFPAPSSNSSGQTLLTITPTGGLASGKLRITYTNFPFAAGPGSASVDIGNNGSIDWSLAAAGGTPQIQEFPLTISGSVDIRTVTGASANSISRGGTLLIEFEPMPYWIEVGDAGELRTTAQLPSGAGPLDRIEGTLAASDCDMYWIHVDDPTTFSATTLGGASFDTQLWLFDQRGYGVTFNDDSGGSLQSTLTDQFVYSPGNYLLAVTRLDRDAISAGGAIWLDTPYAVERQPDGPGAGSPLTTWSGTSATGAYSIFLTGASFAQMGRLVAVASDRTLWTIDPATGAGSQFGTVSSNVGTPSNLAYDPIRDVLYLTNGSSLYSVDLATGSATLIGPFGVGLNSLEFDLSSGQLYGYGGFLPLILYRIDPVTATATAVGPSSTIGSSQSMIYDPRTDTMYFLQAGSTRVVNRATGAMTSLGSNGLSDVREAALHSETGLTYSLGLFPIFNTTTVDVLDLATGVSTQLGSPTTIMWRGLAYVPPRSGVADYGTGCAGQGGVRPVLRAVGPFPHTGTMTYQLTGAAPLSLGFFAFGDDPVFVPLPFPGACPLHISPLLLIDGPFVTGPGAPGSGSGTFTVPLAPGAMGLELTAQGVVLESVDINQLKTSNGVLILQ